MTKLTGRVAIIAGGSRGAGRGIALALGDAGATVYVAGRTSRGGPKPSDDAPGTVEDTAEEVTARGGHGIAIRADLSDANQVAALFQRVEEEQSRLDILANSAWAPNCMAFWGKRFWDLNVHVWRETLETVSVCWHSSVHAIRLMAKARRGLIVHVTDNIGWASDPSPYRGQVLHDLGHECLNGLVMGMSKETKKLKIAVVGLNPGFMRTERVLMYMTTEARKKQSRFDLSESPEYIGRALVALAADSKVMEKNGQLLWAPDLAKEYGFTDIDGRVIPRFDPNAPMQAFPG
jgi:NAD(P)-dependent dehydrogenase (short-subunit alcohol dehydrogenase family)